MAEEPAKTNTESEEVRETVKETVQKETVVETPKQNGESKDKKLDNAQKSEQTNEEDDVAPAKKRTANKSEEEEKNDENETQQAADGENAELDDDQQVENPAYIPKVGRFYMHDDDRRDEDGEFEGSRQLRRGRADCEWKHDRFDMKFQGPKSTKQIVTKYGFDIRTDGKTDGETEPTGDASAEKETAPESTEDDVETRPPQPRKKDRRVSSGSKPAVGMKSKNSAGNRRRPMKQREREDTVDESEKERVDEDQDDVKPAQRRQVRPQKETKPVEARPPPKPKTKPSRSEESEEDEEENVHRGQRRQVAPSARRGAGHTRLRGRLSTAPPRRVSNSSAQSPRQNNNVENKSRPFTSRPSDFPALGRPRGGSSSAGPERGGKSPATRREYGNRNEERERVADDRFENHRRGVIRGAGVTSRGIARGPPSRGTFRGATRTGPRFSTRRDEHSEQSDGGYQRSGTDYSSSRSGPSSNRGTFYNRGGGPSASYGNRGGYSNGGNGVNYQRGGYHSKRDGGFAPPVHGLPPSGPPMTSVGVPANVPPPQASRGTTHGHHGNSQQQHNRIRQPTDVVYFDPQQQQGNRQAPLPPRSKKVIPIVDPNAQK